MAKKSNIHYLLRRQLKQAFGDESSIPGEIQPFIKAVDLAYQAYNRNRKTLRFSLQENSKQLLDKNESLSADLRIRGKVEENLESYISLLQATLESAADGILVVNSAGKIVNRNHIFSDLWNVPSSVKRSNSFELFIRYARREVDGKIRLQEYLDNGSEITKDTIHLKNGRILECVSLPYATGGKNAGRVFSFRDLSEYYSTLSALKKSEEQFRLFFDLAPSGIIIASLDGKILQANAFFVDMIGYSLDQLRSLTLMDITHPEDVAINLNMDRSLISGEVEDFQIENRYINRHGETVYALLQVGLLRDSSGDPLNLMVHVLDITKRRRADAIMKAEREILERIARGDQLTQIMDEIARTFENLQHGALVSIATVNPDIDKLTPVSHRSLAPGFQKILLEHGIEVTSTGSPSGRSVFYNQEILVADALKDSDYTDFHKMRDMFDIRAMWCVPITANSDDPIGCVSVYYRRPHNPGEGERELMERLQHLAGIVIERRRNEEALIESEERYSLALRGATDGLWDWDVKKDRIFFSSRWNKIVGQPEVDTNRAFEDWLALIHQDDRQRFKSELEIHLSGRSRFYQNEHRVIDSEGEIRWVLVRGIALFNEDGQAYRMAGSLTDISSRKAFENLLEYEAMHDSLTGLPNRALFVDRLAELIHSKKKKSDMIFAVYFIDLDRFKIINDSLGHMVGDKLIFEVAQRLKANTQAGDIVARLGGDEFVYLASNLEGVEDLENLGSRLLELLSRPFSIQGHDLVTGGSIGIAASTSGYNRAEEMLRDADSALFRAKSSGRGRYVVFDEAMHRQVMDLLQVEALIRRSIEQSDFELFYQPIISVEDGHIVGAECLLRLPSQDSIANIIEVAEDSSLITQIGEWVLAEACRTSHELKQAGLSKIRLSINISTRQFKQPGFMAGLDDILRTSGADPENLVLELTESILLGYEEEAISQLYALREMGVRLSIDDFGTGYSSLSYLQRFPINTLKIDRAFIMNTPKNPENCAITRSIIQLGHSLGMKVVAEGVETSEQFKFLQEENCDYVQGFLITKALPKSEFIRFTERSISTRVLMGES